MKNNEGSESFVLDNDSKKKDKVIGKISLVTGVLRMLLTTVDLRQSPHTCKRHFKIKSRIELGQIRSHMNWKIQEFFGLES